MSLNLAWWGGGGVPGAADNGDVPTCNRRISAGGSPQVESWGLHQPMTIFLSAEPTKASGKVIVWKEQMSVREESYGIVLPTILNRV